MPKDIQILTVSLVDYAASKGRDPKDYDLMELDSEKQLDYHESVNMAFGKGRVPSEKELEDRIRAHALEQGCEVILIPIPKTVPGTSRTFFDEGSSPRSYIRATGVRLKKVED